VAAAAGDARRGDEHGDAGGVVTSAGFPPSAVDINVHYGPDVVPRSQTANEVIALATRLGLAGVCLRSHAGSSIELARALDAIAPESLTVTGAITLNAPVGGINPDAVEVAVATGARIVSLPTWDAAAETSPPRPRMAPIEVADASGHPLPEVEEVFSIVAAADVCLDLGPLLAEHVLPFIRRARSLGIARILVSHPFYHAQRYPLDLVQAAVSTGATVEHCYMQFDAGYPGRASFTDLVAQIRRLGSHSVVLSSDSGKNGFPLLDECLLAFHRELAELCSDDDLARMFATTPAWLLGLEPTGD
jgi:hypothetical protein